jgi:uncharacterized membrane protein
MSAIAGDVHPPLYYMFMWFFALGEHYTLSTAWLLRLPSLVFSSISLVIFWYVMDELHIPARVQAVAMTLMVVMPFQLWFAQEARMYALLEMIVLMAFYLALRGKWIAFTLAAVAMLYTQNYAPFYLLSIGVVVLLRDRRVFPWLAASGIASVVAYLPWLKVMVSQMGEIQGRYWITDVTPGAALTSLYKLFWASALPEPLEIPAYFVTFVILMIGAFTLWKSRHVSAVSIYTMALLPLALAWTVSLLWQPVMLFRPLIGISPFLYILAAWPVYHLAPFSMDNFLTYKFFLRRTLYAACFIAPLFVAGVLGFYAYTPDQKGEGIEHSMTEALAYVQTNWQAGDVLYFADDGPLMNISPYTDLPQYRMPTCDASGSTLGSLSDATRRAIGADIADLAAIPHVRAWVFAPRSPLHPACYEEQIAPLTVGAPVLWVDRNEYIESGVWLVEK